MRSIKQLIRGSFDLLSFFSLQRTSLNLEYAIYQGGLMRIN